MPENSSCSSASTCSRESCEGCPSKAKGGSGIAKEPMNKDLAKHLDSKVHKPFPSLA